jgi:2-methylcitrate dehydratase PrpD
MDGITGPHRALEGEAGLFRLFESGEVDPTQLTTEFGSSWRVVDFSMKPYPSCRCNHTVIDLGIALHREGVKADDVSEAEIYLGSVNYDIVKGPFEPDNRSQVHAQFNAAYNFARALIDGRIELSSFLPDAISEATVGRLARLVHAKMAPDFPARAIEPARVRLVLKDGTVIERTKMTMSGSPDEPLSTEQIMRKFKSCLSFGLKAGDDEGGRLADCILSLENQSARALVQTFPARRNS